MQNLEVKNRRGVIAGYVEQHQNRKSENHREKSNVANFFYAIDIPNRATYNIYKRVELELPSVMK